MFAFLYVHMFGLFLFRNWLQNKNNWFRWQENKVTDLVSWNKAIAYYFSSFILNLLFHKIPVTVGGKELSCFCCMVWSVCAYLWPIYFWYLCDQPCLLDLFLLSPALSQVNLQCLMKMVFMVHCICTSWLLTSGIKLLERRSSLLLCKET